MSGLPKSNGLLLLPHLKIQNANAISAPLTWGFPAISAFTGLMHALERRLDGRYALLFDSVGVICHQHQAQVSGGYTKTFNLTRNPVNASGDTAAIVQEGRIHLEISLVFGVTGHDLDGQSNPLYQSPQQQQHIAQDIADTLAQLRVAGGSQIPGPQQQASLCALAQDGAERHRQFTRLRRRWLPGFALVSRDDLLHRHLEQLRKSEPNTSLLDAWLDRSRLNIRAQHPDGTPSDTSSGRVRWRAEPRTGDGWIVPIPVGYGALHDQSYTGGQVANARDASTPLRFVESLYSLGEWISPHRLRDVDDLLWFTQTTPETGLYRCRNNYFRESQSLSTATDQESAHGQ